MGRGAKSASGKPYFNKTAKKQLANGVLPYALPGRRYEKQLKKALDEIADNYKRSEELEEYVSGSFDNGIPHLRVDEEERGVRIDLGNMSTGLIRYPEDGLTEKQKQAYIEFYVYGMYQRGKNGTDGNGVPLLGRNENQTQAKSKMSESADYYSGVTKSLVDKADKEEQRALQRMERDYQTTAQALAGSKVNPTKIEAFYGGPDVAYFKAQQRKAMADALKQAIKRNPNGDSEYFRKVQIDAAKKFAQSTVELPKTITGRGKSSAPRKADMRSYFDKDGNPINLTARDGGYSAWKSSWGAAFADKERKRRGY